MKWKATSLLKLTEAWLRQRGCMTDRWERKRGPFITVDGFGVFDLVAMPRPGTTAAAVTGIQVTSENHKAAHVKTMLQSDELERWCLLGLRAQLHLWKKIEGTWRLSIFEVLVFRCPDGEISRQLVSVDAVQRVPFIP